MSHNLERKGIPSKTVGVGNISRAFSLLNSKIYFQMLLALFCSLNIYFLKKILYTLPTRDLYTPVQLLTNFRTKKSESIVKKTKKTDQSEK